MSIGITAPTSIDEYIAAAPSEVQPILRKIRRPSATPHPGRRNSSVTAYPPSG